MSVKKNILYVNWGTPDKEYTFKAATKKGLAIYLATMPNYPAWVKKYVPPSNIIFTNTYNSDVLITDVAKFMKQHNLKFNAILTFFEMNIVQTADLAQALQKPFLNPGVARRSSANKLLMRLWCQNHQVPTPQFAAFKSLNEGLVKLKDFKSPVVIKAVRSGHSYGVMKVSGKSAQQLSDNFIQYYKLAKGQLSANFDEWMEYYEPYKSYFLIEKYLDGVVFSYDGLIQNREIIFAALTEYEATPGPYLLQSSTFIPGRFSTNDKKKCRSAAQRVIKALRLDNCGFHIEMKLTNEGPILLEAAARLPGGKILDSYQEIYEVDLASLFIDLVMGKKLTKKKAMAKGCLFIEAVYQKKSGLVTQTRDNTNIEVPGFRLLSYIDAGGFTSPVMGVPPMYLYYQLKLNSWQDLKSLRKKIKKKFEIKVEKNWLYYLLKIRNLIPINSKKGTGLLKSVLEKY